MLLELQVGNLIEPFSGRRWDRAEITVQIARRIARFQAQRVSAGDRVFLPFGNRLEFFAELLAVWQLGGCAIPVDARLTAFEVENLSRVARPRLAVVDEATPAQLTAALAAARRRRVGDDRARPGRKPPRLTSISITTHSFCSPPAPPAIRRASFTPIARCGRAGSDSAITFRPLPSRARFVCCRRILAMGSSAIVSSPGFPATIFTSRRRSGPISWGNSEA